MDTLVTHDDRSDVVSPTHSADSSLREKILEHLFVGELLRTLWRRGARQVELLRAEVDAGGYDVVLECNGVLRHVQLKSSYRGAKTNRVKINVGLPSQAGPAGRCAAKLHLVKGEEPAWSWTIPRRGRGGA